VIAAGYAILGGGAAGLSLALALAKSPQANRSILVIEKEAKEHNDRTWCYWTSRPSPYDAIRYASWEALAFHSPRLHLHIDLPPYRYQMLRGLDFYRAMRRELAFYPHVTLLTGNVEAWEDHPDHAAFLVEGEAGRADWLFDSRLTTQDYQPDPRKYHYIRQHFMGWEIETTAEAFDPATATLFDLRTDQSQGVSFFYILPFTPRRALVEFTRFSADVLPEYGYAHFLREFLRQRFPGLEYSILDTERGVIPMTDHPFPRRLGRRILAIGSRGGRIKPSTGYAFARIQKDTAHIIQSLERTGRPYDLPRDPIRRRFFDALMLDVFARQPLQASLALERLFSRNPASRVLRFLDEETSLLEDVQVLATLPPAPFLRALLRRVARR
jgi:lycopene beta-cyclase